MIVTCPGCASKYRVRNEAVPADGARMRCPKCDTLFLAKPPTAGDAPSVDEPSALFQQLAPSPPTDVTNQAAAPRPPAPAQPAPAPAAPQAGPVTALFKAFDATQLPPEMQRPPQPAPAPAPAPPPAPSGLSLDTSPKVHLPNPSAIPPPAPNPAARQRPLAMPDIPARAARGSGSGGSAGGAVASWLALALGLVVAVGGGTVWAWSSETVDLDAALMPTMEKSFGVTPPRSPAGRGEPNVDELRAAANAAMGASDFPKAIVLWRRVKARDPSDGRAQAMIAKCTSELGDVEAAP